MQDQEEIIKLVRRWGGAASDAVLDPANQFFRSPPLKGLISYRYEKGCVIVWGDPICAPEERDPLVKAFHQHCQQKKENVIYIAASENFARWAIQNVCEGLIEFGEELVLNPHLDPRARTGEDACLVRRKVRRALKEGIVVEEYKSDDPKLEEGMNQVSACWLAARHGPQAFISRVRLFDDRFGKRWFYARHADKIVGVLTLNRLESSNGWLLNRLMFSDAIPGTPELLVTYALDVLKSEDCNFVTFGCVADKRLKEMEGFSLISTWTARFSYQAILKLFHLERRKKFWNKFHPDSRKSYLLLSHAKIGMTEIRSLMHATHLSLD